MITVVASENVIASLINEEFEPMLSEWEWEQECKQEQEDFRYLKHLEEEMRKAYEEGHRDKFVSLYDFYSDVYKDIHGIRPRWFLNICGWYHG